MCKLSSKELHCLATIRNNPTQMGPSISRYNIQSHLLVGVEVPRGGEQLAHGVHDHLGPAPRLLPAAADVEAGGRVVARQQVPG